MPEIDAATLTKIDNLRTKSKDFSAVIDVYQIVAIYWDDAGTKYYSATRPDLTTSGCPASPIEPKLLVEDKTALFLEITSKGSFSDEEIELSIIDPDGSFADLLEAEGEGIKAEVFFWIPTESLYLSVFSGHLLTEKDSSKFITKFNIANGFRSPEAPLPSRAHYRECQAIFGGELATQDEIDRGGCPYNNHIGGGIGTPGFLTCPHLTPANCTERGIDPKFHLSHQSANVTVLNRQTSGPDLLSTSRGNETNLKKPVRVVMGQIRLYDMEVLAFSRHLNNRDPDKGFFEALYEGPEGPIQSFQNAIINGQNARAEHYFHSLGNLGQGNHPGLSTHSYSATSLIRYNFGWTDPSQIDQNSMRASAIVRGLRDVRVYTDATTFSAIYTDQKIWQIARMLTDWRWGFGLDYDRLDIDSFIECDDFDDWFRFTDNESNTWDYRRGASNVELDDRTAAQQIEDMCWTGRLSRPFWFGGKIHIIPLKPLSQSELDDAPVFSDEGNDRNIIWEEQTIGENTLDISTLNWSKESDSALANRIEATYRDSTSDYLERPAPPVEDVTQQLAAGKVFGDTTRRKITKKESFLSVTSEAYAVALAHHLLWFGKFEEGGTKNNLEISFKIWFLDALALHEYKVIKVESTSLTRYGFDYFRIKEIQYNPDLSVRITAQAYNRDELDNFESSIAPPGGGGGGGGDPDPRLPCLLGFGAVSYTDGLLEIPIDPC